MTIYLIILFFFMWGLLLSIKYFGHILDFVAEKSKGRGVQNGSWKTHLGVGRKSTSQIERAAIAHIGLGANDSDETIYWNAFTDNNGDDLHSSHNYQIVFTEQPQVKFDEKGFWSITVYGNDKFLIPNEDHKYVIHSDKKFELDSNNQFSIYLAKTKPEENEFWLPLAENEEKFTLAYRCYKAEDEMKNKALTIELPQIIKN